MPCPLSILRTAPPGSWTVCYHHNSWSRSDLAEFTENLEKYRDDIASLDELLGRSRPWRAKWCYRFCTSPRLSSFVLRAHLKLWKISQGQPNQQKAIPLSTTHRTAEAK